MGYFLIFFILILAVGIIWARNEEKKKWNDGFSALTGEPWIHFDTDSQGGRMYKTRSGHDWCDISYNVDK
jgi:hypothetical protein